MCILEVRMLCALVLPFFLQINCYVYLPLLHWKIKSCIYKYYKDKFYRQVIMYRKKSKARIYLKNLIIQWIIYGIKLFALFTLVSVYINCSF